ncbi:MAG: response regulator [Bacteroidetes bacterium]|nr:response regulator [Bacteroidota bacterium]
MDENSLPSILLVEDDPINVKAIGRFLRDNYKVEKATNGKDAISFAKENSFDVILMDIGLKGEIDGLAAAREIRKMEKYKATRYAVQSIVFTKKFIRGDLKPFF